MLKFTKTILFTLVFGSLFGFASAQTWGGPGSGSINNSIWRNGNVAIGQSTSGIAALDVRGDNIYLAPTGTTGFNRKFIGIGESGGSCNIYGMRVQRNTSAFINVGVKQPTGIQQFGADLPFSPVIAWGNVTPVPAPCFPFPCINFQDAPRPLRFEYDNNDSGCGDLIADMNSLSSTYQFRLYGSARATGSWISSDARYKNDVNTLKGSLDMVTQLRGVSYGFNNEEFPKENFSEGRINGFIAQEIKEVLPTVVKEDEEGFMAVNYDAVIPVLVEAIKEQNEIVVDQGEEIAALRSELAEIKAMLSGLDASKTGRGAASTLDNQDKAELFQNVPNPVDGITRIPYYLPQNVANAQIVVTTINGQVILRMELSDRGNGEVSLDSNILQSGVYTYTLVVDGERTASKRLAVTK